MKTAAMSELKARLREYLDQGKGGSEILITDRGKPVARLVPLSESRDLRESLVRVEKQGLIRPEDEILGFFGDHSLRA